MRMLKFDRAARMHNEGEPIIERDGATLRLVAPSPAWTPRVVDDQNHPETSAEPRYTFQAEVRAKRFGTWTVDDERYSAMVRTSDNSPQAVMAALADACAAIPELRRSAIGSEHLILQVSLATCP